MLWSAVLGGVIGGFFAGICTERYLIWRRKRLWFKRDMWVR